MLRRRVIALILCASAAGAGAFAEMPSKPRSRRPLVMSVTAYCLDGETRAGTRTRKGTIAADPRVLPLGSVIRVEGLPSFNGRYTVVDTGRTIKGHELDIFIRDCAVARKFGRQEARVRVLRRGWGARQAASGPSPR